MPKIAPEFLALQRLYHWKTDLHRLVPAPWAAAWCRTSPGARWPSSPGAWTRTCRRRAGHRQQGGHPVQKLRLVDDERPGHLDGRLRVGAAVPHAAPETITQILTHRKQGLLRRQTRRLGTHEAGSSAGLPCISYPLSPDDARRAYEGWDAIMARTAPLERIAHTRAPKTTWPR